MVRNPNFTPVSVCVSHGDSLEAPEARVSADEGLGHLGQAYLGCGSRAEPLGVLGP